MSKILYNYQVMFEMYKRNGAIILDEGGNKDDIWACLSLLFLLK